MLIDPPSQFAPLAEWREFLTEMERALAASLSPQDRADVQRHAELARSVIARADDADQ